MRFYSWVKRITWILIGLPILISVSIFPSDAQSPLFSSLIVELWPEYDQPDTLVIYRVELSPSTTLPAEVTFQFPGYIDNLNAIAFEEGGQLFSIPSELIEQTQLDNALRLTLTTNSPRIHLEYYDPMLLTTEGDTRHLLFDFAAPYPIQNTTFQVQEPLQAENFALTPAAASSFRDDNGLNYHMITAAGLAPGDTMHLEASYGRSTAVPSTQLFRPEMVTQSTTPETTAGDSFLTGYLLLGMGVALLVATGGYWWWNQRSNPTAYQQGHAPKRRTNPKSASPTKKIAAKSKQATFCTQCGTALRPQSHFCHMCGTERRSLQ